MHGRSPSDSATGSSALLDRTSDARRQAGFSAETPITAQGLDMRLGLGLDLYKGASLEVPVPLVQFAERLGYHSVWTAEAYGADALSPLAFLAAHTRRIKLAAGVVQIDARTPAATAMHAMTIDALSGGGRVIIGLGVSGPQVVEGWHGMAWGSPTSKLRDYTAIIRKILARREPVTHDGAAIQLPYRGPGALGQGKPLKSILHPCADIEVWIASGGPRNVALAAEIADGWLPMGYGMDGAEVYREPLDSGLARRSGDLCPRLEIFRAISVEITDDVAASLEARKPITAMFVGGMGSDTHNFHADAMARRGWSRGRGSDRGTLARGTPRRRGCRRARRIPRLASADRFASANPRPLVTDRAVRAHRSDRRLFQRTGPVIDGRARRNARRRCRR